MKTHPKSNVSKSFFGLSLALVLAACSQTKQLKEMHDSTGQMAQTTQRMDDNMSVLKQSTKGLCDGSTQALTREIREGALVQLDNSAVVPADKLAQAVVFVEAFDFQASPLCMTAPDMVDKMLDDAALEFYQTLQRYDVSADIPNPLLAAGKPQTKSGKVLGFNAMAAAMHRVNRMQTTNKDPKTPIYSILSITEQSLLDGLKVDKGQMPLSSLKRYEIDILANKPLAVKILQARQNMISAAIVSFATVSIDRNPITAARDGSLMNTLRLAGDRYVSKVTGQVFSYNFDISQLNVAQLFTYTEDLQFVLETRGFLNKIGVVPVMDSSLKALLAGATPLHSKGGGVTSKAMANAQQSYISTLNELKSDIQ